MTPYGTLDFILRLFYNVFSMNDCRSVGKRQDGRHMSEHYFGIILYGYNWSQNGPAFLDYFLELQRLQHFPTLNWFRAHLRDRSRKRRYRWKDANLVWLREELEQQKIKKFSAEEKNYDKQQHGAAVSLTFCNHMPWPHLLNYCVTAVPQSLLKAHKDLLWELVRLNGQLGLRVGSPYGCAVMGGNDYWDLVYFADGYVLEGMPVHEFGSWGRWQYLVDKYVRGAFWGNFLNDKHVHRLGGIENIKGQRWLARCIEFDAKLTFFCVTPDIETAKTDAGLRALDEVYAFLKPIKLPEFEETPDTG